MSTASGAGPAAARPAHDRLLIALAAAGVAVAVVAAIAGSVGAAPSPIAMVLALGAGSVALRVAFLLRRRRSAAASADRVADLVSLCGLGLALVASAVTVGLTFRNGGDPRTVVLDVLAHAWGIGALMLLAASARTLAWRAPLGILLCSFLAVSAAARMVGSPVVDALGASDVLATSLWVPVTEELLKAAPVAVVAILALRDRTGRPAAVDLAVLGFASGAGFALNEDAQAHRAYADLLAAPPLSVLFPTVDALASTGAPLVIAGHAVWTALVGLGIGIAFLYRRRFRFAWVALPVALVVVIAEHAVANASRPADAALALTAHGILSTVLLIAGVGALAWFERRPWSGGLRDGIRGWLKPSRRTLVEHRIALAARQRGRAEARAEEVAA